ncbi:MAG: DUF5652 family protein [Candidatus Peribacteraceae bacterium]|nr:DUF5652 family protein [Candidatus Peribacteraceae bacterium]
MLNNLSILKQNLPFLTSSYGVSGIMGVLLVLAIVDVILKGWAMWRAARMGMKWWFIPLLIVNSVGILPVIFLLATNTEYARKNK